MESADVAEVGRSAEAFVDSRTRVAHGEQAPELLYHYTSADGLVKILQSGELWATSIRHLNDSSEYVHVLKVLEATATKNALTPYYPLDQQILKRRGFITKTHVFVGSFSEAGNLLSQWRAYCPPGGGYSIGFRRTALEEQAARTRKPVATSSAWRLVRCEYDPGRQEAVLRSQFDAAHFAFHAFNSEERDAILNPFATDTPFERLTDLVIGFYQGVLAVAPAFKDHAFREEAEWRVVSPVSTGSSDYLFRAGRFSVIPYVAFPLPTQADKLDIAKIIVGPTENAELARDTVRILCQTYAGIEPEIELSGIPFRHWDGK